MGDDASTRGEALRGKKFARSDEVGEGVDFVLALTFLAPAIALVLAAAHMADRVDEAAIDERKRVGGESRRHRHAIGAISVKEERGRAVELCLFAIEQRDRDGLAVLSWRQDSARDVEGRIVPARNFLGLAKRARASSRHSRRPARAWSSRSKCSARWYSRIRSRLKCRANRPPRRRRWHALLRCRSGAPRCAAGRPRAR